MDDAANVQVESSAGNNKIIPSSSTGRIDNSEAIWKVNMNSLVCQFTVSCQLFCCAFAVVDDATDGTRNMVVRYYIQTIYNAVYIFFFDVSMLWQ